MLVMSKKNQSLFDVSEFLDLFQDRVKQENKPLKESIKNLQEGQKNICNLLSSHDKRLGKVETSLSNHVTDTNKKIDKLTKEIKRFFKKT